MQSHDSDVQHTMCPNLALTQARIMMQLEAEESFMVECKRCMIEACNTQQVCTTGQQNDVICIPTQMYISVSVAV